MTDAGSVEWVIDQDVTDGPENPGETATLAGYTIAFDSFDQVPGPNYMFSGMLYERPDGVAPHWRETARRRSPAKPAP